MDMETVGSEDKGRSAARGCVIAVLVSLPVWALIALFYFGPL